MEGIMSESCMTCGTEIVKTIEFREEDYEVACQMCANAGTPWPNPDNYENVVYKCPVCDDSVFV